MKNKFLLWAAVLLPSLFLAAPSISQQDQITYTTYQTATFAGGCFWCTEADFDKVPGVVETLSGYIGGHVNNPTYKQVSAGGSGHTEAVQIRFDPNKVDYEKLLAIFWRSIDPTTKDRQFCDHGKQYRSGVFYHNPEQQKLATQSKMELDQSKLFKAPIVTEITAASEFYVAEDYHQNFYTKNPIRYKFYRYNCGRDKRLEQLWGEKS